MKNTFFYLLLLCSTCLFSQENKNKGDFEVMLSYGNAKVDIANIQSVGYLSGVRLKKEFTIHKNYAIVSGVDLNNFFLGGGDFHFETKYVSLPVSFRAKMKNGNSTLYAEFGGDLNYQYKFKGIDNVTGLEVEHSGLGSSIGLFYKVGYKYDFSENLKFNLALFSGADLSSDFKSDVPESEIDNFIGIELGL
ncbi:MAG TPA: hypothetical protein VLB74_10935, partial [Flavobacterium sp.]|uniref:hypothetical protein n=1 Tax=Flavobacterium sp. TaxID=239 RepID=UPI002B9FA8B8